VKARIIALSDDGRSVDPQDVPGDSPNALPRLRVPGRCDRAAPGDYGGSRLRSSCAQDRPVRAVLPVVILANPTSSRTAPRRRRSGPYALRRADEPIDGMSS